MLKHLIIEVGIGCNTLTVELFSVEFYNCRALKLVYRMIVKLYSVETFNYRSVDWV